MGRWTESSQTALQGLGHHVQMFYYDEALHEYRAIRLLAMSAVWSQQRRGAIHTELHRRFLAVKHRSLAKLARDFSPQLVVVMKGETIPLSILEQLRFQLRVPIVAWWVDNPFRFPETVDTISFYDRFFIFDRAYMPQLKAVGVRRITFLPCACDPSIYHPMAVTSSDRRRYTCEVAFVAGFYHPREQLVEHMAGLDVAIWGPGWKFPEAQPAIQAVGKHALRGKKLDSTLAARLYNVAKVCINIHHPQSKYNGLNTRTFEVLASGGFALIDSFPGTHELLEPGKEVVCYGSFEEARELTEYYITQSETRAEIGNRGRLRVLAKHTYRHRMETLLDSVAEFL